MVDNFGSPLRHKLYLFSGGLGIGDAPMPGHLTDTRPSQAPMGARWPDFPRSGSAHRLGRQRPRQQITDRPPTTRQAGRHRRSPLAVPLGLALSTTVVRVGQREPSRLMRPHEVIVGI
jgi:hypothetical protein